MQKLICTTCGSENNPNHKYCFNCGYELPKTVVDNSIENTPKQAPVKSEKRNTIIGLIVGALFFSLSYYGVQKIIFAPPSFDKLMMATASELNKSCPIMVDEHTRFDNAIAMANNSFQYNYTLVDVEAANINPDTLKKYILPGILNNVKTSPDLKFIRDHETTLIYNYRDKTGAFILKLPVSPEMYK